MNIRRIATLVTLAALTAAAQPAAAQENIKIGALRCDVGAGLGLIVTSSKPMACIFTSARGNSEHYSGRIQKFGIDIGVTNRGVLAWDVFAQSAGSKRGALAGDYVGADASVTLGAGVGANALVGGFGRSFTLQPFSIEVQSGLALAAGVASMTLRAGG